ncbi:hypothetical protein CSA37_12165 [Candidatus Fermentibacteria bacterium]|nr:MAG: hypothetical protein CSA37_12165 [Candidatus Fermentibacteria bacterium]
MNLLLALALSLPCPVTDAAKTALEGAGITPEEMNFDRHWVTGVELADSLVVGCLQDIWLLPEAAEAAAEEAVFLCGPEAVSGGMDSLLTLMEEVKLDYSRAIDTLACADTLAMLCAGMWADSDSAGTPGEWGLLYSSRGAEIPFDSEDMDIELDRFTELLARWTEPENPRPELVIGLVQGMEIERSCGTINAPGVTGGVIDFDDTGEVTWVIGGTGRNTYTEDCSFDLIIDAGGDDLYLTGGEGVGILESPVSVVADLAGNDSYISDRPVSQGSGFMGYGVLVDLSGDDTYRGSSFSQGSAMMGGGLFADLNGCDHCLGGVHSQGAATLGSSWLIDLQGDDFRKVSAYGQGFAGPAGKGHLVDCQGSDTYLAGFTYSHEPLLPQDHTAMSQGFSTGLRPFCAGGVGTLCDLGEGNDTYRAEVFGQGGAYFYSLGILYDAGGQDVYSSAQYSQGSGIHLASGILMDVQGDDQYVSRFGPSQGAAHDLSTGMLLDMEGEDCYATDSGQGAAMTNSAAVFVDMSGSDLYAVRNMGYGASGWARGSAGSGLFLDMADRDFYMTSGADDSLWIREYSAGLDLPAETPVPEEEVEETGNPSELEMDSLFSIASEWGVSGNRERVLAHREELASRGAGAVDYILEEHLDSWSGLEHRAIRAVFNENSNYAAERLFELLADTLAPNEKVNAVSWLGETAGEEAMPVLKAMLADSMSTGLTVSVLKALGNIGNTEALPAVLPFAEHESERIRRQTAVTLGEMGEEALETLERLAGDSSLAVRSAALRSMDGINDGQD